MIKYRVFISYDGDKRKHDCVRIFKEGQQDIAKAFAIMYIKDSAHGAVIEVIKYSNGKAVARVWAARRK